MKPEEMLDQMAGAFKFQIRAFDAIERTNIIGKPSLFKAAWIYSILDAYTEKPTVRAFAEFAGWSEAYTCALLDQLADLELIGRRAPYSIAGTVREKINETIAASEKIETKTRAGKGRKK